MAPVLKTGIPERVSGVRIPPSPPVVASSLGLRESDKAFDWLEQAIKQRFIWFGYLKVEPQLDPLRSDSNFNNLLHRVG